MMLCLNIFATDWSSFLPASPPVAHAIIFKGQFGLHRWHSQWPKAWPDKDMSRFMVQRMAHPLSGQLLALNDSCPLLDPDLQNCLGRILERDGSRDPDT